MSCVSFPPSISDGASASMPPAVSDISATAPSMPDRDIELPAAVDSDDLEMIGDDDETDTAGYVVNGFDDCVDDTIDDDNLAELLSFMESASEPQYVPKPEVAQHLSGVHQVAEFYSPPRVLPDCNSLGLVGTLSLDLVTGWDFRQLQWRVLSLGLLTLLQIRVLIISPPCTAFSALQRMWNFKRMTPEVVAAKLAEGMLYVRHAMDCARKQYTGGRLFVFEHPASASSWDTEEVRRVAALPNVMCITFDQCMMGLKAKTSGIPMRKRTKLLKNSRHIAKKFSGHLCDRSHDHELIQGSDGGMRRSVWAQFYPPLMVNALAQGAVEAVHM